jgi:hypothetical protein
MIRKKANHRKKKGKTTMKITRNMFYNPSTESEELTLCIENNGDAYRAIMAAIENLKKKAERGTYDPEKATILYYHIATEESKRYYKNFGYSFTVTERWTAAVELEEAHREEVFEGLTSAEVIEIKTATRKAA